MTTLENDHVPIASSYTETQALRMVWDWPTRLFHWGLAVAMLGCYITNRLGTSYFTLHLAFGYLTIVLVVFRGAWGFVGTKHARFKNFVQGPRGVLGYISAVGRGRRTRYAGHNPLGALMVLTLLLLVGGQAGLGLFGDDEIFNAGPLAGLVAKPTSLFLTSLHRRLFYVIFFAVMLHIAAVLAHVIWKREPLIRAMVTGFKPSAIVLPEETIASSRSFHAVILFIVITAAFFIGMQFAPQPADAFGF